MVNPRIGRAAMQCNSGYERPLWIVQSGDLQELWQVGICSMTLTFLLMTMTVRESKDTSWFAPGSGIHFQFRDFEFQLHCLLAVCSQSRYLTSPHLTFSSEGDPKGGVQSAVEYNFRTLSPKYFLFCSGNWGWSLHILFPSRLLNGLNPSDSFHQNIPSLMAKF